MKVGGMPRQQHLTRLGKLEMVKIKGFRIGTLSRTSYDANTLRSIDLARSVSDMFQIWHDVWGEKTNAN